MDRRKFIKTASGVAVASAVLGGGYAISRSGRRSLVRAGEKPNIVLFVADDLGWNDLGCYGNADVKTPNIDRLAAEGVRFTNAFVTASSCSPSRACIITGQYPHTNGVTGLTHVRKRLMLSPFATTLPDILSENGYNTAFEGKWHVAPYYPTSWYGYRERLSGMLPKDFLIRSSDKALKFIEDNKDNAFFLQLDYMDTHRDDAGEFSFVDGFPVDPEEIAVPEYYTLPDWPAIRTEVAKYYSNAAKMDMMIGQVLAKLDELDLTENTLVCFVSDNGAPFPGNKMTLYDRGTGTPLILRRPGAIPAGAVDDNLINTIDIMPTLLEVAGCTIPESVQGKSMLSLATGESSEPLRDAVFTEMTYHVNYLPMRAVRTTKWKYIRNYSDDAVGLDQCSHMEWAQRLCKRPSQGWIFPRVHEELFDLESDPNEQRNLAGESAYKETLDMMRKRLDDHMRETDDPFLGKEFEKNYSADDFGIDPENMYL
jgi:N-sulfoglucosamine sulfohydrolase